MAFGLSAWPRPIRAVLLVPLMLYAIAPLPFQDYRPPLSDEKPLRDLVRELGRRYQVSDVMWLDPGCNCGRPVEWAYYESIYYPGGLIPRITDISQAGRRVWYVSDQRSANLAIAQALSVNRVRTAFFGPYYLIADLYEAPPHSEGLLFGPALDFWGADLPPQLPLHPGDTFSVRLWWSSVQAQPSPTNAVFTLSVSAPDGTLTAETDESVQPSVQPFNSAPTDSTPGKLFVDAPTLTLPTNLKAGMYTVTLALSDSQGSTGTKLSPDPRLGDQISQALILGTITVFNY